MTYTYPPRTPAGSNSQVPGFQWLRADPQADVSHVDLRVLRALNDVGAALHRVITIQSGYRDPAYSQKVGGYADDPHTRGVAADAQINGQPIGLYPQAVRWLNHFGLESGAQPGFYQGKSDPEHVQIPGSGANKAVHALFTLANRVGGASRLPYDPSQPPTFSDIPHAMPGQVSADPLGLGSGLGATGAGCGGVLVVMLALWTAAGAAFGWSIERFL